MSGKAFSSTGSPPRRRKVRELRFRLWAKSSVHFLAPPLPTKPATLGFGGAPIGVRSNTVGSPLGGQVRWKLAAAQQAPRICSRKSQPLPRGDGLPYPKGISSGHASDIGHWLAMTRWKIAAAAQEPAVKPLRQLSLTPPLAGEALMQPICAHRFVSPNRGDVGCADRGVTPGGVPIVPQGHLNLFFILYSFFLEEPH